MSVYYTTPMQTRPYTEPTDRPSTISAEIRADDRRQARTDAQPPCIGDHTIGFALECHRCHRRTDDPAEIALGHNQLWWWANADTCIACATPDEIRAEHASILEIVDHIYRMDHARDARRRRRRRRPNPKGDTACPTPPTPPPSIPGR